MLFEYYATRFQDILKLLVNYVETAIELLSFGYVETILPTFRWRSKLNMYVYAFSYIY